MRCGWARAAARERPKAKAKDEALCCPRGPLEASRHRRPKDAVLSPSDAPGEVLATPRWANGGGTGRGGAPQLTQLAQRRKCQPVASHMSATRGPAPCRHHLRARRGGWGQSRAPSSAAVRCSTFRVRGETRGRAKSRRSKGFSSFCSARERAQRRRPHDCAPQPARRDRSTGTSCAGPRRSLAWCPAWRARRAKMPTRHATSFFFGWGALPLLSAPHLQRDDGEVACKCGVIAQHRRGPPRHERVDEAARHRSRS